METTPRDLHETTVPPTATLPVEDRISPFEPHDTPEGIKDRAQQMTRSAMEIGTKILSATTDKIHLSSSIDLGEKQEVSKRNKAIITGIAIAGIGATIRHRRQAKSTPATIIDKAKHLVPSR